MICTCEHRDHFEDNTDGYALHRYQATMLDVRKGPMGLYYCAECRNAGHGQKAAA